MSMRARVEAGQCEACEGLRREVVRLESECRELRVRLEMERRKSVVVDRMVNDYVKRVSDGV